MEYFGIFAFIMAIGLYSKVHRLERTLRENGIGAKSTAGLGDQLRKQVGQTVMLTLEDSDGDLVGKECKVLDADEDWALVRANEGKKNQCEKLIRLDRTVDAIRERFGADAVIRAAFLGRTIDHMSGGISREKRSVDYEKVRIW